MTLWDFLNSSLGLVLIGFLLTSILGALLSWWLQRLSWKRQTRLSLYMEQYNSGITFLDALSELVSKRFYFLQQWLWSIEGRGSIDEREREYYEAADDWNIHLRMNRSKIRLLISEKHANRFLDLGRDPHAKGTLSIHNAFAQAHNHVLDVRQGKMSVEDAQKELDKLNSAYTSFLEDLTDDFLHRAASLELLKSQKENHEA